RAAATGTATSGDPSIAACGRTAVRSRVAHRVAHSSSDLRAFDHRVDLVDLELELTGGRPPVEDHALARRRHHRGHLALDRCLDVAEQPDVRDPRSRESGGEADVFDLLRDAELLGVGCQDVVDVLPEQVDVGPVERQCGDVEAGAAARQTDPVRIARTAGELPAGERRYAYGRVDGDGPAPDLAERVGGQVAARCNRGQGDGERRDRDPSSVPERRSREGNGVVFDAQGTTDSSRVNLESRIGWRSMPDTRTRPVAIRRITARPRGWRASGNPNRSGAPASSIWS